MAKTRVKKVVVSGVTRDQMEEAFGAFAFADAKLQGINAAMDAEITKIRERNAEEIAKFQQQKDDALEVMQTFATENRDELFSKKKSMGDGARRPRVPHRDTEAQNPQGLYVGGGAGAAQRVQPGVCPHQRGGRQRQAPRRS